MSGEGHISPASREKRDYRLSDISQKIVGKKVESPKSGRISQINLLSFKNLKKTLSTRARLVLRGYAPQHPKASEIASQMKLAPNLQELSNSQKQKIVDECIKSYRESLEVFESAITELSSKHPDAKEFAQAMAKRIGLIAKAYQEILGEMENSTPVMKELKIRLATSVEFASEGTGTGNIGFNPIAIENALKEGTLREHMSLIYASLWTALPKIFDDPELVDKINIILEKEDAGFQINTGALRAIRESSEEKASPVAKFFAQAKPLAEFRKSGGRIVVSGKKNEPAPKVKDIQDLTLREARAALEDYISEEEFDAMKKNKAKGLNLGKRRVQWVRGKDLYRVDENTGFYRKAIALGGLPIVTGPSGTTDSFLQGMKYLGMTEFKEKGILALTSWMVSSGDHSYHEIKEAGSWHGVDYTPGPDSFESAYPNDPDFQKQLEAAMQKRGKELPGRYLSSSYQLKAAQELGFIGGSNAG